MATRSAIIKKAMGRILQGAEDKFWSYENWNDYFHEACWIVFKELVESDLSYYKRTATIELDATTQMFPLPVDASGNCDVHRITWMLDSAGKPLFFQMKSDNKDYEMEGFILWNDNVKLVNIGSLPSSINIEYIHRPKELGDWDGSCDFPTTEESYAPDAPLDNAVGARILARIIKILANSKDGIVSSSEQAIIDEIVQSFIEVVNDRQSTEDLLIDLN